MENLINTALRGDNKRELDRLSKLEFTDITQLLLINPYLPMSTLLKMCNDKDCDKSFYAMERFEKLKNDVLIEYYKLVQNYIIEEIEDQIKQYTAKHQQLKSFISKNINEYHNFKNSVENDIFKNYLKNRILFNEDTINLIDGLDDCDDGLCEIVILQAEWMFDCLLENYDREFDVLQYLLNEQYIQLPKKLIKILE